MPFGAYLMATLLAGAMVTFCTKLCELPVTVNFEVAAGPTFWTMKSSALSWLVRVKTMMALPETAAPPSTSRSGRPGTSAFQDPQALPATAVQAGVAACAMVPVVARAAARTTAPLRALRYGAWSRLPVSSG